MGLLMDDSLLARRRCTRVINWAVHVGAMRVGPYTFFYTVLHMWSIVVLAALFRNELRDDNKNSGMPFSSHLHFSYELPPL